MTAVCTRFYVPEKIFNALVGSRTPKGFRVGVILTNPEKGEKIHTTCEQVDLEVYGLKLKGIAMSCNEAMRLFCVRTAVLPLWDLCITRLLQLS